MNFGSKFHIATSSGMEPWLGEAEWTGLSISV